MVSLFIRRPIATTLLAIGLALAGFGALFLLPVAPLPNIDIPTIVVSANMAGASPEVMSNTVATPLERHLGAIADVTEMTSRSSLGSTQVVLQFDINRDIDGAARDVQAAINAAHADLPTAIRSNPTYRKFNPNSFPIMILALTSKTLTPGQIYDQASNVLQQKLSQISGVGDVSLAGAALPAVRIELNPRALFKYGIGLEDVRAAISSANAGANSPKGAIEQGPRRFQVYSNDNASAAADYKTLIIAYRNNSAVRLQDVADVTDGVENIRNAGMANGQPAVLVTITQQPGANVIDVVDRITAMIPQLQNGVLPPGVNLSIIQDTTVSIRNSVHDVEITLMLSTILVVLVVFLFLRNLRATLVPAVSVPLSLLGTFGGMYLLGFSLDNFSLMALIISTGFVVDNTIVVLENVTRHLEMGEARLEAALNGAREVTFTVISMSISLVAVFLPILLMGGILGRLFHEFAVTLTLAIFTSLIVSLTVTPMMCAYLDFSTAEDENWLMTLSRGAFDRSLDFYRRTLNWSLDNPKTIIALLVIAIFLNWYLFVIIPKGFFPDVDEGRILGNIRGDQSISYQAMEKKFVQFMNIIRTDPAVANVGGSIGGGGGGRGGGATNTGQLFITLKSRAERDYVTSDDVIQRLRPKLDTIAGARMFMFPMSSTGVRSGGRQGNGTLQYTVQADTLDELNQWLPKITDALQDVPELEDVNSDQQDKGLEVDLKIDRASASRLGLTASQIDNTLYDAFGQRQVSTIYKDKNQYHVIMEVAPNFWQSPETLRDIYVSTAGNINGTQQTAGASGAFTGASVTSATSGSGASGAAGSVPLSASAADTGDDTAAAAAADAVRNQQLNSITSTGRASGSTGASVSTHQETMVPLSAFVSYGPGTTPLSVNHQSVFVATTFSFDLPPGVTEDQALTAINRTMAKIDTPISIHGEAAGTLQLARQSLENLPLLFVAAVLTIYIVLGILYESYIHPITILSTLPSAGVGAVLALLIFKTDFSLIAFIGVILLVGVVKKNAIIMIDFAVDAQRRGRLTPREAIYRASLLRFRPIMMTTLGAILGALPLAVGLGEGSELRQPLGISIVGGLLFSQMLTLYTTPVVYLYLDRFGAWAAGTWNRWYHGMMGDAPEGHSPPPAPAE
ncbi:MAG TPA: efflux RND transporter permease subunit [Rhizomicrobium sp.]|jgi:multidrug efflux pump|nr:efflux RND transporter permease subunit [Rhizomicrobium sp.]